MGKDPAVLLYTGDFLSATQGLTLAEIGQLIKLLCVQHQTGHLSKKTIRLSVGKVSRDVLALFEVDENGLYYSKRLDEEIAKRLKFSESRRNNIQKRYKKDATYVGTSVLHMENENENDTENEYGNEDSIDKRKKGKYGELENVKLTLSQFERLKKRFPVNYERYIDDLSYYIASKGDKYKSHYAAILSWHRDKDKADEMSSFDTDDFFQAALKRSEEHINRRAKEYEESKNKALTDSKGNPW